MRRDHISEYAAHAFSCYGVWRRQGCPLAEKSEAFLADMEACRLALSILSAEQYAAVSAVYFAPIRSLRDRCAAVRYHASHGAYADERTIYRWLAFARGEFAKARGLNAEE